MADGEVNEFLVVGVFAGSRGFGGDGDDAGAGVEMAEDLRRLQSMKRETHGDMGVGQHPRELFAHGRGGQPQQLGHHRFIEQGCVQGMGAGITEHQHVEHDVGVQNQVMAHTAA